MPPINHAHSDDADDASSTGTATGSGTTTRAGLSGIDPVLCGVIERARFAVAEGVRAKTTFKYDMNSRCVFRRSLHKACPPLLHSLSSIHNSPSFIR